MKEAAYNFKYKMRIDPFIYLSTNIAQFKVFTLQILHLYYEYINGYYVRN